MGRETAKKTGRKINLDGYFRGLVGMSGASCGGATHENGVCASPSCLGFPSEFPAMPILPQQRDIFPASLLDPDEAALPGPAHWVAFYTLARREKDLMRKLESLGIPFYAPLVRRRLRTAGGRTRSSQVPLFPGYVFAPVDDGQRRSALATNTVARWLSIPDERMLVDDLRAIKRLVDTDKPLTPEARLEPGQLVRVRSGALRGLEGVVVKRCGEERLLVAVHFLNQGASIDLERL
jgi:transcription antitermination factor NusG